MFGFVARALYYGNLTFEDDRPDTLAEAMASLEKGLRKRFDESVKGCIDCSWEAEIMEG
jgi:hypothetical protein